MSTDVERSSAVPDGCIGWHLQDGVVVRFHADRPADPEWYENGMVGPLWCTAARSRKRVAYSADEHTSGRLVAFRTACAWMVTPSGREIIELADGTRMGADKDGVFGVLHDCDRCGELTRVPSTLAGAVIVPSGIVDAAGRDFEVGQTIVYTSGPGPQLTRAEISSVDHLPANATQPAGVRLGFLGRPGVFLTLYTSGGAVVIKAAETGAGDPVHQLRNAVWRASRLRARLERIREIALEYTKRWNDAGVDGDAILAELLEELPPPIPAIDTSAFAAPARAIDEVTL